MHSNDHSATADTIGAGVNFERRALTEGGATLTVFSDGSYTAWVPRAAGELASRTA